MGTDYVHLFHKELADQVLSLELDPLITFLEENVDTLKQKGQESVSHSSVAFVMEDTGCSIREAVSILLEEEGFNQLRKQLALDFGFSVECINLDYWGCYAEVFGTNPEGSISNMDYLPEEEEEWFLLLQVSHVDIILKSLQEHIKELRIMGEKEIEAIIRYKDLCVANPSYLVAYMFDF